MAQKHCSLECELGLLHTELVYHFIEIDIQLLYYMSCVVLLSPMDELLFHLLI